ncbi:hypothetical protein [Streptomyces sp. NPDC048442]|uniref:hypothetical protein n=1 Tax=Streptomyces sp. NPDC048442 TaxID=3154823 RepID=UPI0034320295
MRAPTSFLPARLLPRSVLLAALGLGVSALASVLFLTSGPADDPRPLRTEEAEQLAVSRFSLYEKSPLEVVAWAPMGSGTVEVRAVIDYRAHRAVGTYTAGGSRGLLAWDATGLAAAKATATSAAGAAAAAGRLESRAWSPRPYSGDPLDVVLRVAMGLGTDRPDNPQLLAQQGAQYLGRDQWNDADYSLYSGPRPAATRKGPNAAPQEAGRTAPAGSPGARSPFTYWVNDRSGLGRVEIRAADAAAPSRIEFGPTSKTKVPGNPWGAAPASVKDGSGKDGSVKDGADKGGSDKDGAGKQGR